MQNILNKTGSLKNRHLSQSHKVLSAKKSQEASLAQGDGGMLDLLNLEAWKNKPQHMRTDKNLQQLLKNELATTQGSLTTAGQTSSANISAMKGSIVSTEQSTTQAIIGETASMQPKERADLLREQEKYLEYHRKVRKERAATKNSQTSSQNDSVASSHGSKEERFFDAPVIQRVDSVAPAIFKKRSPLKPHQIINTKDNTAYGV